MAIDVRYAAWFAGDAELPGDLPATPKTLAYEGFTLTARALAFDCRTHGLGRIKRATHSASTVYGAQAAGAVYSFLTLLYADDESISPDALLAEPSGLYALRHSVAHMYSELDGDTRTLMLQHRLP